MKRLVVLVTPSQKLGWDLVIGRERHWYPTKKIAVKWGRAEARESWELEGRPSQLVIRGRNGRIQREFTYGKDPRRFPG